MKIKKLKKEDILPLYKIGLKQFRGEKWYNKRFIENTFRRRTINYVCFEKNKLIGGIMVDILDFPKAWIFFFIVDKEYRRKGIGTKILREIEKNLPKSNNILFVDLEKTDREAINFYEKNGFQKVGEIENWFGKEHTGLLYEKIIKI